MVFNFKLGGIAAGIAFVLSLMIGLLSRTLPPTLIIRPIVFAGVFFIITNLIFWLVNRFLPELLENNAVEPDIVMPGSQVNIMEDNPSGEDGIYAQPDGSEGMGDIGNIDYSAAGDEQGMDQSEQNGYTNQGISSAASGDSGSFDALQDMDSLAGSFFSSSEDGGGTQEYFDTEEGSTPKRTPAGNKPQKLAGDFDPKEIAQGIRTILKKDEG
jgi:hypothetical protein